MDNKRVQFNPLDITESLGYQTFRRDSRKPWSREEDQQLNGLINANLLKLGFKGIEELNENEDLLNQVNWDEISEMMKTRKSRDCRKRWVNSLNPNLKKGKWTSIEDEQLLKSFQKYGSSWQKIAVEIPGRTEDQCAKRYIEVLDPNTRDRLRPWTIEEDLNLIKKVKSYGTKWRTISLEMESRPSLTCRNRWRKIVTDVVRGKANDKIKQEIDSIQGGLSKVEEISENFQNKKVKRDEIEEKEVKKVQEKRYQFQPINPTYESPKPTSIELDWKYTLKDTSGLTLSNGNISSDELAKKLIENAKQYDLKISIHQHIHHHYGSTNNLPTKAQSPASSSNLSGQGEDLTYRYSHFNYLPPMAQPQLQSSNIGTRDNNLKTLLNPKRRRSSSHQEQIFEELDEELDFWETMRSLSQFNTNTPAKKEEENYEDDSDELGIYYGMEETVERDLGFPGPVLPFNPS